MAFSLGAVVTFDDLLALLERYGVPTEIDATANAVIVPTKLGEAAGEAWLRWDDTHGVFVCFIPLDIALSPDAMAAVNEATLRVNHRLAVLGFGVDHEQAMLYYRASLGFDPTLGLDEEVVHQLYATAATTAARFSGALTQVATGARAPADVLEGLAPSAP